MKKFISLFMLILFLITQYVGADRTYVQSQYTTTNQGQTLYVGGDGPGNYSTIQNAINDAYDGCIIFVYQGTYYEHIEVDKSINITGENRENTIINNPDSDENVVFINKENCVINGFTIQNSGISRDGILTISDETIIYDCIIKSNDESGIDISDSNNNDIFNCIFIDNTWGIELNGWDAPIEATSINNCTFYQEKGFGILL